MMKIKLWADLMDETLMASVDGDVITVNGEEFDFSVLEDGYRIPGAAVKNKFFYEGDFVERKGGDLHLTLRLPVQWDSPEEFRNPQEPMVIIQRNGPVRFPDTTPVARPIAKESDND